MKDPPQRPNTRAYWTAQWPPIHTRAVKKSGLLSPRAMVMILYKYCSAEFSVCTSGFCHDTFVVDLLRASAFLRDEPTKPQRAPPSQSRLAVRFSPRRHHVAPAS